METTPQIDSHLKATMNLSKQSFSMSKKDIIVGNFLGGMFWGIGTVVGAGVIMAIIGTILSQLGVFNAIGGFFGQSLPQQFK